MSQRFRDIVTGRARGVGPFLARRGLGVLSVPYRLAVGARNALYDRSRKTIHRIEVPVVSVGNLTVGGTGKTPCVEWVAGLLRRHDIRLVILSRGYKAGDGESNDEAMVLADNLPDVPHLQGASRAALARIAVEELEAEALVLDDGFQHRRLARDLDIVLIDATEPWGGGHVLPRGLLREPASSLRRAGFVVLTRCDQVTEASIAVTESRVARLAPGVPTVRTAHRPVTLVNGSISDIGLALGRPALAFCGVGNPASFRRTVGSLGADVVDFAAFPDHHNYTRDDVAGLEARAAKLPADGLVLTTQKDWVKIRLADLGGRPLWAVRVALTPLDGGGARLERTLLGALGCNPSTSQD